MHFYPLTFFGSKRRKHTALTQIDDWGGGGVGGE